MQDACGGHPQVSGQYHFHALPSCWQDSALSKKTHLIGWALDGFGIYVEYDASGKLLSDSALDACHGRTSLVSWDGTQRADLPLRRDARVPLSRRLLSRHADQLGDRARDRRRPGAGTASGRPLLASAPARLKPPGGSDAGSS